MQIYGVCIAFIYNSTFYCKAIDTVQCALFDNNVLTITIPQPKEVVFLVLSVCLSVCLSVG